MDNNPEFSMVQSKKFLKSNNSTMTEMKHIYHSQISKYPLFLNSVFNHTKVAVSAELYLSLSNFPLFNNSKKF